MEAGGSGGACGGGEVNCPVGDYRSGLVWYGVQKDPQTNICYDLVEWQGDLCGTREEGTNNYCGYWKEATKGTCKLYSDTRELGPLVVGSVDRNLCKVQASDCVKQWHDCCAAVPPSEGGTAPNCVPPAEGGGF